MAGRHAEHKDGKAGGGYRIGDWLQDNGEVIGTLVLVAGGIALLVSVVQQIIA